MVTFAIIGAIAGALLGIRFKVLVLIPAILVATVVVIITGHQIGQHVLAIVLSALATISALEIGYMVGCVVRVKVLPSAPNTWHFPSAKAH